MLRPLPCVSSSTGDQTQMSEIVYIEATGLGGKDIGLPDRWNMSIRTDPEGQNVYGPSLATVEDVVVKPFEWSEHQACHCLWAFQGNT